MDKAIWYLKQLLPLRYETTYSEDRVCWRSTWWMWLGRSFAIQREPDLHRQKFDGGCR